MAQLILVKHATPEIVPDLPAREWHLSEAGRQAAVHLARPLPRGAEAKAVVSFEYGGVGPVFEWRSDPQVIASQTPRLYGMVHGG